MLTRRTRNRKHLRRRGVACVELAMVASLLVLLILGVIDVGQFVNVGQSVSNACREGARVAARQTTTDTAKIRTAVTNYLTRMHPNLPSSAVQVSVSDVNGTLSGGGIAAVPTGAAITVQVVLPFDSVRWTRGMPFLNGSNLTNAAVTRRE